MENARSQARAACELCAVDIMHRHFVAIRAEASLRELATLLSYYGVTEVPVVHGNGQLLGTASAADLFQLAAEESGAPIFHIPREPAYSERMRSDERDDVEEWSSFVRPVLDDIVGMLDCKLVVEIMAPVTVSISPSATTSEVAYVMLRSKVERAPVLQNGRMIGVITLTDLLRAVTRPGHTRSWEADEPFKVPADRM